MITLDDWRALLARSAPWLTGQVADALCLSALSVGARIADGERYGVRQHEETITESVLIDLCRLIPRLRVRSLSRQEETAAGADWEWWIEGAHTWFGFMVQAKRVHRINRTRNGYSLGYRPDPARDGTARPLQIESLLAASERLAVPAIYALYNEAGTGQQYTRPQFARACIVPHGADGVTALGAWAARWLLATHGDALAVDVETVAPHAFPWSCLAFCLDDNDHGAWPALERNVAEQLGFPEDTDAADTALAAARFVLQAEQSVRPHQFAISAETRATDVARIASAVRPLPPSYVLESLEDESIASDQFDAHEHPLGEMGLAPRFVVSLSRDPRQSALRYYEKG